MKSYLTARLNFHEHRWSYHLRKSGAPLIVLIYLVGILGTKLPVVTIPGYICLSILLNVAGKVVDHYQYHRTSIDWYDTIGDLLIIGMLPVPALLWSTTGSWIIGLGASIVWLLLYTGIALLGWSNEQELVE